MSLRSFFKGGFAIAKNISSVTNFRLRALNESTNLYFSTEEKLSPKPCEKLVNITFVKANGEKIKVKGKIGDSLLDVVVNNSVDLDGFGACEGTLTCSTCHLIFKEKDYNELPEKPSDEELDMLDLAYDLTETSRLGCQIFLSEKHEGLEVMVPATINDARE
ncbi:adrenodoxin-like protein 2, mitochondrial [Coccinella septempunctata]|uniref:adrenodoxin-like protein 2, mitochondrial n=1 Tax=Coccinella septempunctata TaxID=41139 RepID=UPI001D07DB52|nr:adrenodoxin-like protein 2, mitochondrial [Coccinella septempunctata]